MPHTNCVRAATCILLFPKNGDFTVIRLFFVLFLCMGTPALAQSESQIYDPTFTGKNNEAEEAAMLQKERQEAELGFIAPTSVNIALVHPNYMEDHQFGIQMSVPDVVSGCFNLSPLEYEANFVDPYYLDIKVKKYRMTTPKGRAELQKCDLQNKQVSGIMLLDKNDLMRRGTQEIRFSSDAGRDTYKIILTDKSVELVPDSASFFKPQGLTGALKDRIAYNFNDAGAITLHVPMAQDGEDITAQIESFAMSHALAPAESGPMLELGDDGGAVYHFKDSSGRFSSMINEDGYAEIGTISVMRPYDGPEGRTQVPVDLSVFVTRPGTKL